MKTQYQISCAGFIGRSIDPELAAKQFNLTLLSSQFISAHANNRSFSLYQTSWMGGYQFLFFLFYFPLPLPIVEKPKLQHYFQLLICKDYKYSKELRLKQFRFSAQKIIKKLIKPSQVQVSFNKNLMLETTEFRILLAVEDNNKSTSSTRHLLYALSLGDSNE